MSPKNIKGQARTSTTKPVWEKCVKLGAVKNLLFYLFIYYYNYIIHLTYNLCLPRACLPSSPSGLTWPICQWLWDGLSCTLLCAQKSGHNATHQGGHSHQRLRQHRAKGSDRVDIGLLWENKHLKAVSEKTSVANFLIILIIWSDYLH